MNDWCAQIIAEFRANGGKAAQFGDARLVILHTTTRENGENPELVTDDHSISDAYGSGR